jgi:hypothetical protein
MRNVIIGVLSTLLVFWILVGLGSCAEDRVYIGPTVSLESGDYFCTFENKEVFYEYMQER